MAAVAEEEEQVIDHQAGNAIVRGGGYVVIDRSLPDAFKAPLSHCSVRTRSLPFIGAKKAKMATAGTANPTLQRRSRLTNGGGDEYVHFLSNNLRLLTEHERSRETV